MAASASASASASATRGWSSTSLSGAILLLGCVLAGLPAVRLLAPTMFPIAKKLGIHDIR